MLKFFTIVFLFLSVQSFAQTDLQENFKRISDTLLSLSFNEMKGYNMLRELCDIGPRLSGSDNNQKAVEWSVKKMKELGFDTVWLQPVMVPHWIRGENNSVTILSEIRTLNTNLNILALGSSVSTEGKELTAEVVEVKSFEELDSIGQGVKGKIVFFNSSMDPANTNTFNAYGNGVKFRSRGAMHAAKYGAVGVLIKSVTTRYDNTPHTGMTTYADTIPKIPAVSLSYLDAEYLSSALTRDPHLKVSVVLNCQTLPDALSYNVIGDMRGSEYPDEIVAIGGHLDSWDAGDGAHDDGAGVIHSIESLYLIRKAGLVPKRTLRCILFANEENGLRGGLAYGRLTDSLKLKHTAIIESDRGGYSPRGFSVSADSSKIESLLKLYNSWLPWLQPAGIEWIRQGGSGADISKITSSLALIGFVPDAQRYFDVHHSGNDVFEEVHPRELQLGSAANAIFIYLLSQQ